MAVARWIVSALASSFVFALPLDAQVATGTISGRVVDATSAQGVFSVDIRVDGTRRSALTRDDGSFSLSGIPAGTHAVRATRIGFAPRVKHVTVTAEETATVNFTLVPQAAALSEIVVTGYGMQRREAISGSVSTVDAVAANVGVVSSATGMLQGRVAGVHITTDNGEPGAASQVRVRGGTSISASNDPLYVVDGMPLQNDATIPGPPGTADIYPQVTRSPLNSISPNDIESITVLKDASATAIYGSRGANGVILIQTKRVAGGAAQAEYETYIGASMRSKDLGLASGAQYRAYVTDQVAKGKLPATAQMSLGTADTDWEKEISQTGLATNHSLAFSGGSPVAAYRASLNYFKQQGVLISNQLERYQGRLNATHDAFSGRLRLGLEMMAARVNNDFAITDVMMHNMAGMNPTIPVRCTIELQSSPSCAGKPEGSYFETAAIAGSVSPLNPVALAEQLEDVAPEHRILGSVSASVSVREDLTSQTTVGVDYNHSVRRAFMPRANPFGAQYNGFAQQADRSLQNINFQQLLTYSPAFRADQELEIVGGYEYTKIDNRGFEARMQGFITDAFGVNNLAAGTQSSSPVPTSYWVESALVSFFSRATYGFAGRYFFTGVIRQDGSSRLAEGHRWQMFPAISASWRLSKEGFLAGNKTFSTLALRAGWGKQGNQAVAPYQTQLLLRSDPGAIYPFGNVLTTGLRAAQVGNPDLKWETVDQVNVGIDYGLWSERFTGVIDLYQKTTRDLLLEVDVPQPAVVSTRLENVGNVRNRGVEATVNTPLIRSGSRTLNLGLVASVERNEVISLGDTARAFIATGWVSGQTGQYSQRIMPGEPLGTFFAPRFRGVNAQGQQEFACKATSAGCVAGRTTNPTDEDREVIGSANPSFTIGLNSNGTWGAVDASWLWRGEFGGKVFNNTALAFRSKSAAKQGRNFLAAALADRDDISEPAKFSDRWIEDRTFVRLQNVTIGYKLPARFVIGRSTRVFVSGDNLLLFSDYTGYDPEVFSAGGLASRGIDMLSYPRSRTYTLGARVEF